MADNLQCVQKIFGPDTKNVGALQLFNLHVVSEGYTVLVFPNPSTAGIFTVQTGDDFLNCSYSIHDALGRVIASGTSSSTAFTVDLSSAAADCYTLTLQSDGREERRKIIIDAPN